MYLPRIIIFTYFIKRKYKICTILYDIKNINQIMYYTYLLPKYSLIKFKLSKLFVKNDPDPSPLPLTRPWKLLFYTKYAETQHKFMIGQIIRGPIKI